MKIAIVRGGKQIISRRNRSIASGANLLRYGTSENVILSDIHIDESGMYVHDGISKKSLEILPFYDFYLDTTGSGQRIKGLYNEIFRHPFRAQSDINRVLIMRGISIPKYIILRYDINNNTSTSDMAVNELHYTKIMYNLWRTMHMPIVIASDSKDYTTILTSNYNDALEHIRYLFSRQSDIIISEYKDGDTYTVTTMPDYRGEKLYIPIVHKILKNKYALSCNNLTRHDLNKENLDNLINYIRKAHNELAINHPVQWDIVKGRGNDLHIVKVNISPDFHPESKFMKSINSTGVNVIDMLRAYADKMSHL